MWLLLLPVLLLTLLFLVINKIKAKNENKPQLPPSPPKLPIIGNLHQLGSLPHQSLWKLSKSYGHVMGLHFGTVPAIVVSSAEAAKEVLKTNDLACCNRPSLTGSGKLSYNNLDITFSPYGEHWRQIRRLCVLKLFSSKSVQSFQFIRDGEIDSLNDFLNESSVLATPVNLSVMMSTLMASMTFRTAFGKRFAECGLESDVFEEMIHRAMSVLGTFAACDLFPHLGWIIDRLTGVHAKFERSFRELDNFFQIVIAEHLNRTPEEGKEDLVDLLLSIERGEYDSTEVHFTRDCTKAIIMDIFVAGVDTAALTVTWAMAELARNPRVMKKVQDEIRSCLKKSKVTESDIHQLQYLKMVVKETLRLHPAAPLLLPRECISQFKVGGYEVYPKTFIHVNVWAIGRDPNYWYNPEEFFPERFADSSIDFKGQHFEYLPFGAGRRGCPGMIMALTMVELTLANLLCCFDWKLSAGMKETDIDMEEASGITTFKKSALKLVPVSYQWPSKLQT
ncbi:cytochrome P450 71B34-like [Humulus lupulus]|uniref:cytochrome P450 71B34-like n=1 Tax=Humulus lupulus TaxID=3486 RepID=UPI002B40CD16|nr:cytochrome P450 71B34-like [Humulus lupulus]